jgi:hypothetical protein
VEDWLPKELFICPQDDLWSWASLFLTTEIFESYSLNFKAFEINEA